MTKLQLALDTTSMEKSIRLLEAAGEFVDIVEIGTPWLLQFGAEGLKEIRSHCSSAELLCDGKIMDAGDAEAKLLMDAGANWVTVMALTDERTIRECVRVAHEGGAKVMADMLCVEDVPAMVRRLEACNVDCIAVHVGLDQQAGGVTPLSALKKLAACKPACMTAVAGGISANTIDDYLKLDPDIVIVGGGIGGCSDPRAAALRIRECIDRHNKER